jgi:hypothetical protein
MTDHLNGKQKKMVLPSWSKAPFSHFLTQTIRLSEITRLSCHGIYVIHKHPYQLQVALQILELLGDGAGKSTNEERNTHSLEVAQKDAELAANEIQSGFPVIYSNGIVAQWALLEAMTRSILVAWIKNDSTILRKEIIGKLRIRIGEYELLTQEERYHYIAELLEAEVSAGLRYGIDRFEALLKPIGLDGATPKQLRKDIFEFGQVRNAIVHRGGIADRQLLKACPWLKFQVGEPISIHKEDFERYGDAALNYVTLLIARSAQRFGFDTGKKEGVYKRYGESIAPKILQKDGNTKRNRTGLKQTGRKHFPDGHVVGDSRTD